MRRIDTSNPFYYATNVSEAVLIAEQLKSDDRYDVFRGQICNFPIQPSIYRAGVDKKAAINRLNLFAAWVHGSPELQSLHSNVDAIAAVAQHYGIRTSFLDFTTSPQVAGFFAAYGEPPPANSELDRLGCIICANRRTFEKSWLDINARSRKQSNQDMVRIVEIDVKNLWRLQAQKGIFIDVRVDPNLLEMFSSFFRILFPFTGRLKNIHISSIYPENKSHLENLIEQYFYRENFASAQISLLEVFESLSDISQEPLLGEESAFIENRLPPSHQSWSATTMQAWRKEPDELYQSTVSSRTIRIRIRAEERPTTLTTRIQKQIIRAIKRNVNLRDLSIRWIVLDVDNTPLRIADEHAENLGDDSSPKINCSKLVSLIWDGMRRLPFTDEQIACSIGNYLALAKFDHVVEQLFGLTYGIELGGGGARTRAFASHHQLLRCIRQDIFTFVVPERRREIQESKLGVIYELFSILLDPSRLFEFSSLIDLFAKEIIPSQVLIRLEGDMFLFSPAQLEVLGNA
jgi:hypothetical protein